MLAELIAHRDSDYEIAHSKFMYSPTTGELRRKKSAGNTAAGALCTRPDTKGYYRAYFNGKTHKVHRIAWLMQTGDWPTGQLDHINNDKKDNRITNLRLCTTSENCLNQHGPRQNNKVGFQGVHIIKSSGRFRAVLKGKHIGVFPSPEQAHAAYLSAKQEYLP